MFVDCHESCQLKGKNRESQTISRKSERNIVSFENFCSVDRTEELMPLAAKHFSYQ
jgi:hypothetical protein